MRFGEHKPILAQFRTYINILYFSPDTTNCSNTYSGYAKCDGYLKCSGKEIPYDKNGNSSETHRFKLNGNWTENKYPSFEVKTIFATAQIKWSGKHSAHALAQTTNICMNFPFILSSSTIIKMSVCRTFRLYRVSTRKLSKNSSIAMRLFRNCYFSGCWCYFWLYHN